MRFSINSLVNKSLLNEADEIQIHLSEIKHMTKYILEHKEKRFVFLITNKIEENELDSIIKYIKNKLQLTNYTFSVSLNKMLHLIKTKNIPFYSDYIITDFETLYETIKLGVSDVVIGGQLGFYGKTLEKIKKDFNINIRVLVPSVTNLINENYLLNEKSFFILPKDIDLYSEFIDIMDFSPRINIKEEEVLFNIYKKQEYDFSLKDLVKGLSNLDVPVFMIPKNFGLMRYNCEQKCFKEMLVSNKACAYCSSAIELAKNLNKTISSTF